MLLLPTLVSAQDRRSTDMPRDSKTYRRYDDRLGHDSHEWNEQEDRYYRQYLQDSRRNYRQFDRINRRDQERYWRWRHAHNDMERRTTDGGRR